VELGEFDFEVGAAVGTTGGGNGVETSSVILGKEESTWEDDTGESEEDVEGGSTVDRVRSARLCC